MGNLAKGIASTLSSQRGMTRRIVWVTGSYYPDIGGAEISVMSRACLLKRVFGQVIVTGSSHGDRVVDGVPVIEVRTTVKDSVSNIVEHFQPHFLMTSGRLSLPALEVAVSHNLPCVYFLSAPSEADFTNVLRSKLVRVVANSSWVADEFAQRWSCRPTVLDPPVLDWQVIANSREAGKNLPTVTHVGDSFVKGGFRILGIAEVMPEVRFLVTRNWSSMRTASGWDQEILRELRETEGATTYFEEELPDFSGLPNVVCREPFTDVRALYAQTDVLIVASVWREPFGRVVVEGLLNDLPVVLSPEVYNERWEGLVYIVDNPESAAAWRRTILAALSEYSTSDIRKRVDAYRRSYSVQSMQAALLTELSGHGTTLK